MIAAPTRRRGVRWTETHLATAAEHNTEVFVTAGVRYDLYADRRTPCASPFGACAQHQR